MIMECDACHNISSVRYEDVLHSRSTWKKHDKFDPNGPIDLCPKCAILYRTGQYTYKLFPLNKTNKSPVEMPGTEDPPTHMVFHHDEGEVYYTRIGMDTKSKIAYYMKGSWRFEPCNKD